MKKLLGILTLFLISNLLIGQNRSISFQELKWNEIKQLAKKENKLIFLDAYASWCGPCKMMAKSVFTNDTVADFYNSNFISAKIDMEKGEGVDIAKEYKVRVYPSLLFINGEGILVHRVAGSMSPKEFVELGKNAMNPDKQLITYQKKFDTGFRDINFIKEYIGVLQAAYIDASSAVEVYFNALSNEQKTDGNNLKLILECVQDVSSPMFKILLDNQENLYKVCSKEAVNQEIFQAFLSDFKIYMRANNNDTTKIAAWIEKANKTGYSRVAELIDYIKLNQAKKNANWNLFAKLAEEYVNKYTLKNPSSMNSSSKSSYELNEFAWTIFEKASSDKKLLLKAEKWAEMSVNMLKMVDNMDTYANIQFALGKKKQALQTANEALEIAKKNYPNQVKDMEALIIRIKSK